MNHPGADGRTAKLRIPRCFIDAELTGGHESIHQARCCDQRRPLGLHPEGPLSIWLDSRSFSSCFFWSVCSLLSCSRVASVPGVVSARAFYSFRPAVGLLFVIVSSSIGLMPAFACFGCSFSGTGAGDYVSLAQRERFCLSESIPAHGSFLRRFSFIGTSLMVNASAL